MRSIRLMSAIVIAAAINVAALMPLGSRVVIELNPESTATEKALSGQVVRKEKPADPAHVSIAFRLDERLNLSFAEELAAR